MFPVLLNSEDVKGFCMDLTVMYAYFCNLCREYFIICVVYLYE